MVGWVFTSLKNLLEIVQVVIGNLLVILKFKPIFSLQINDSISAMVDFGRHMKEPCVLVSLGKPVNPSPLSPENLSLQVFQSKLDEEISFKLTEKVRMLVRRRGLDTINAVPKAIKLKK